jgi:hypothetical protein
MVAAILRVLFRAVRVPTQTKGIPGRSTEAGLPGNGWAGAVDYEHAVEWHDDCRRQLPGALQPISRVSAEHRRILRRHRRFGNEPA